MEDYGDMYTEFAIKTIRVELNAETDKICMRLPSTFLGILHNEYRDRDIFENSTFAEKLRLKRDKLIMKTDVFLHFFRKPVSMILEQLRVLLMKENFSDISLILGVGAFSKIPMMYDAIRKAFPEKIVIVPEDGLAILKGAVLFGHTCTLGDVPKAVPSGIL